MIFHRLSPQKTVIRADGRRGFALLVTVTLLAFLVLLLVSLATLTRVETQVAGNSQKQIQARQNALLALNIALGQLQKAAGPDQRVTGAADIAGADGGVRLANGATISTSTGDKKYWAGNQSNGLAAPVAGTRYWTGVWGNSDPSDATTAGNGNGYEKTPRPVLLNWLVSGNENATFQSSPAGRITTAGAGFAFTPTGSASASFADVTPALSTATSATTALTFGANGQSAVLLVGSKTAGTEARDNGSSVTGTPVPEPAADRYVVAPLMPITAPAGSVPGLGATATPSVGRYAYWVGDEGVKARLNLADSNASATDTSADPLARMRLRVVPRSGAEVVADTSVSGTLPDFGTTAYGSWSQSGGSASKAISMSQVGMLDSTTLTPPVLGRHFNDFTTSSIGLEADVYNGGLKRDLTCYLGQTTLPAWTGTAGQTAGTGQGILPTAYSPVMNTLVTADKRVPRWDIIHSFYNLPSSDDGSGHNYQLTGQSTDIVYVRPATATQVGIFPVVVEMRLLLGATGNSTDTATTATAAVPSIPAHTSRQLANPLIVLANPYPVALSAPNGIDLKFNNDTRIDSGNNIRLKAFAGGYSTDIGWVSDVLGGGRITLHIPAFTLARGKAAAFYVSGAQKIVNGTPSTVEMIQMDGTPPNAGGVTFQDYIYCDYGWSLSGSGANVRPSETGGNSTMIAEFSMPGTSRLLKQVGGINLNRNASQYSQVWIDTTQNPEVNYPVFVYVCQYNEAGDPFPYGSGNTGEGNTALRSWTDFNPRAGYFRVTNYSNVAAPYVQYFMPATLDNFNTSLVTLYWGRSSGMPTSAGVTVADAILFDLPRKTAGAANDFPVASLAALQHADLTAEDIPGSSTNAKAGSGYNDFTWEFGTNTTPALLPPCPGHQPAYALGNSYASIFLLRGKSVFTPDSVNYPLQLDNWGSNVNGGESSGKGNGTNAQVARNYYDIGYLLNTALWDGYFFSTVPRSGPAIRPVNPRLSLTGDVSAADAALVRSGEKTAAHILVKGAFNINSTSVDAWAAVLGGMKNLPAIPGLGTGGSNASTVYPRTLWQSAAAVSPATGTQNDSYSGYRQFSDADIRNLAEGIVKQVRMRGPFVSLAQFVNRVLVDAPTDAGGLGQSGALQRAIDMAGLNVFSDSAASATNDTAAIPTNTDNTVMIEAGIRGTNSLFADGTNAGSPTRLQRSTSIPGWLTQADVLQPIGPVLSARSDTFVIRTYGEVLDPVNSTTANPVVTARAWCEAVVQRTPDYVNTADSADTAPASATKTENQTFGRRFKIVSFRWLSPNDI